MKELFAVIYGLAEENVDFDPQVKELFMKSFSDGYSVATGALTFRKEAPFGYFVVSWGKVQFPESLSLMERYASLMSSEELVDTVIGKCLDTSFISIPFALGTERIKGSNFTANVFQTINCLVKLHHRVKGKSMEICLEAMTNYGKEEFLLLRAGEELEVNKNIQALFDDEGSFFGWCRKQVKAQERKAAHYLLESFLEALSKSY
jgi:hypothetical protein